MSYEYLDEMSIGELEQLIAEAQNRLDRRQVLASAPDQAEHLSRAVLAAQGVEPGRPWVASMLGYPAGWPVTHAGRTWQSTTSGNRAEPGTDDQWTPIEDTP